MNDFLIVAVPMELWWKNNTRGGGNVLGSLSKLALEKRDPLVVIRTGKECLCVSQIGFISRFL